MTEQEARIILRGPLKFGDPQQIAAVNRIVKAEEAEEEGEPKCLTCEDTGECPHCDGTGVCPDCED